MSDDCQKCCEMVKAADQCPHARVVEAETVDCDHCGIHGQLADVIGAAHEECVGQFVDHEFVADRIADAVLSSGLVVPVGEVAGNVHEVIRDNGGNDLVCQACGRKNTGWFTDNALWNTTVGDDEMTDPGGILCATCFTGEAARVHGIRMWRIVPEESGRAEPMSPIATTSRTADVGYGDELTGPQSTPISFPKNPQTTTALDTTPRA